LYSLAEGQLVLSFFGVVNNKGLSNYQVFPKGKKNLKAKNYRVAHRKNPKYPLVAMTYERFWMPAAR
jgi:hypothetical protein